MSDSLSSSIRKIKSSAESLNSATNQLHELFAETESFLVATGVGVIEYCLVEEDFDGEDADLFLGYVRRDGKYRFIVELARDDKLHWSKAWAECDRATKIKAAAKLPDLLQDIAEQVESEAVKAQATFARVSEALGEVGIKGGKKK